MPRMTWRTRSSSALNSVKMPATFLPPIKMSFGHLISGCKPVSDWIARRRAVAEATVNCVVSCGRKSGRSKTENQSPLRVGRNPFAAEPAAALRLRFGENDHAFLHAVARELFNHVVRRGRLLENADVAADDLGFAEPREQIVRVQRIRRARPAGSQNAGRPRCRSRAAQFLDARPDRRAADAQLLRQVARPKRRRRFARNAERIFASVVIQAIILVLHAHPAIQFSRTRSVCRA